MSSWIRLAEIAFATALVAVIIIAWRDDRRDRTQLATQLSASQQAMTNADARQHDRDAQLQQTLAAIAVQKRATLTPAQILADLPHELPLPTPLTVEQKPLPDNPIPNRLTDNANTAMQSRGGFTTPAVAHGGNATEVAVPPEDLKPLYDFALDCKACQAKLTATQTDLADEKTKSATLTKERDAALKAARGGNLLQRVGRAAKWLAIGAAAGALAAKSAHH